MLKLYQILIIEQYLFSIRVKLLYAPKRKHEIIKDFRKFIKSCIKENPEDEVRCKQDLYDLFGTVDRVVKNNMSLQDETERKDYEKVHKIIKAIVIILLSLIMICFMFNFFLDLLDSGNHIEIGVDTVTIYYIDDEEASTDVSVEF